LREKIFRRAQAQVRVIGDFQGSPPGAFAQISFRFGLQLIERGLDLFRSERAHYPIVRDRACLGGETKSKTGLMSHTIGGYSSLLIAGNPHVTTKYESRSRVHLPNPHTAIRRSASTV
jgi:hypothetical protein